MNHLQTNIHHAGNEINYFHYPDALALECGKSLDNLVIGYHTYGTLNAKKDNVIWVCHALTANSNVFDWWSGLFGDEKLYNPSEYFIICANILSAPYGTTNPLSINPTSKRAYYLDFPEITIRDMVQCHQILANHLEIAQIHTIIGGSMGGQQSMEWAIMEPHRFQHLILLATNAFHSPWGIAFNESQRLAIATDRTFFDYRIDGGLQGLKAARSIALLSYRGYEAYQITQTDPESKLNDFKASSYQNYQGMKLVNRYNAYSYWYLSKAMDSHHVGRNRASVAAALNKITAKTLVIAIENDGLFPPSEQQYLAKNIPNALYKEVKSSYAHDGFLIETTQITEMISNFYNK